MKREDLVKMEEHYKEQTKKFITAVRRGDWYKVAELKKSLNNLFVTLQAHQYNLSN